MAPEVLPVCPESVPDALTARPQWVDWRYEQRDGKWTKVPVNPRTGHRASPTNPATWGTFAEALAFQRTHTLPGIGYVFSADDPFAGIDLDKCLDPETGDIEPWAADIVVALDSYAERSPSGTGVHIIVQGALPTGDGVRRRTGRIEMYEAERYFTITGQTLDHTPPAINDRSSALRSLHARVFAEDTIGRQRESERSSFLADDDVIAKCRSAANAAKFFRLWAGDTSDYGGDDSAADLALLGLVSFYTQDSTQLDRLFRRSGLYRDKWERVDYRERTIRKALDRDETYTSSRPIPHVTTHSPTSVTPITTAPTLIPDHLVIVPLSSVEPEEIHWLWPKWLARGKVHIIGGHPGDGKSTLTTYLASVLSTGARLPDGFRPEIAGTLFLLGEDALGDTLRPRLDLHGADVSRINAIESVKEGNQLRSLNLSRHIDLVRIELMTGKYGLFVIDPITAFMPKTDRNSEGDVRDVLTPLAALASEMDVAILAVMHVGKPNGTQRRPLQSLLGATAFGAAARVVWMVCEVPGSDADSNDPVRRVLGVVKSNLHQKPPPLEWSRAMDAPIAWHGESAHDIDLLLSGAKPAPIEDAKSFLINELKGGSKTAVGLKQASKSADISWATLRRAADALGIVKMKERVVGGAWLWSLPLGHAEPTRSDEQGKDAHQSLDTQVSTFDDASANSEKPRHDGKMLTVDGLSTFEDAHSSSIEQFEHLRSDPRFTTFIANCLGLTPVEFDALGREIAAAPPNDPDRLLDLAAYREAQRLRGGSWAT